MASLSRVEVRVPRFLLRRKDCISNASLSFSEAEVVLIVHNLNKSINKALII